MRPIARLLSCTSAVLLVAACGQPATRGGATPDETTPPTGADVGLATYPITDREWTLVAFGDGQPVGATAAPVTLRLAADTRRVSGSAGCNQYGGSYALEGQRLTFTTVAMTRMACAEGMAVEQRYVSMLSGVTTYTVRDSTLALHGAGGPLATFRVR